MNYQIEKDLNRNYAFSMRADRRNLYLQPDFGIKFNRHLELGLFARFNYLLYDNLNTAVTVGDAGVPQGSDQVFLDRDSRSLLFIESGASLKAGWTNMKFHVQLSPNINLYPQHLRYQRLNLNLGLSFNADLLRRKGE